MYSPRVERRYVTMKRMEKRTPEGELLSVTNTRTVHYNNPQHRGNVETRAPVVPRHRSHSVSPRPRYSSETLKRQSFEYIDPPFVKTEPSFESYSREDEYHKLQTVRAPPPPSPRRRQETVTWRREEVVPEPVYEAIDWDRPERREQIYFGRDPLSGDSPLSTILDRINEIRRRNGKRELVPCPRLAAQAGRWAERIVTNGVFRKDVNEKMCIWRGGRVTPNIVDDWYEEAVEFKTSNYINLDWLRTVGAGSAFWPSTNQYIVVVIFD